MNSVKWFVYIILTEKKRLYTGISTDVERRFFEHLGVFPGGAKFFRSDIPEKIVYIESFLNRSEATIKEASIKKLTRQQKENLIKGSSYVGN